MLNMGTQFTWWMGVVEDRNDPLQLGRCRVRCYGFHSQSKGDTPTDNLPWAQPIQAITSAAMGDVGQSATGLVEGSWVVGFFLDGEEAQRPVIMGSIAGIPTEQGNPKLGFNDPNPRPDDPNTSIYPRGTVTNETARPDTNRLARNDSHPMLSSKDTSATSEVPIANRDPNTVFWNERKTTDLTSKNVTRYNTSYPKNHVYESESGHIKEVDDTTDAERLQDYHRAGTFNEIDADGTKSTRIVANNYVVIAGSDYVNIKGSCHVTIDSNCFTYIKGNWDIQVDGNKTEVVKGNTKTLITGTTDIKHGGVATYQYVDDFKEKIDKDYYVDKEGGFVDYSDQIIPPRTSSIAKIDDIEE